MKVSELTAGKRLDSLVAIINEWNKTLTNHGRFYWVNNKDEYVANMHYSPSTNGAQAFELAKKHKFAVDFLNGAVVYSEELNAPYISCNPELIEEAICKAVCAAKWGDTIPDEVMVHTTHQNNIGEE